MHFKTSKNIESTKVLLVIEIILKWDGLFMPQVTQFIGNVNIRLKLKTPYLITL